MGLAVAAAGGTPQSPGLVPCMTPSSMYETCQWACGRLHLGGGIFSHWSSVVHRITVGRRSGPHRHSLGMAPSTGGTIGTPRSCGSCSRCHGYVFRGSLGWSVGKRLPFFFPLPTLVTSAIKADSVLRQQRPRGMYSKVSLTNGWDAGKAVLHRGRAQWGRRTCMYCTLHAGGGACHDHRGSTPRNCVVVTRSKTKIKE